jgi:hypothetical protein
VAAAIAKMDRKTEAEAQATIPLGMRPQNVIFIFSFFAIFQCEYCTLLVSLLLEPLAGTKLQALICKRYKLWLRNLLQNSPKIELANVKSA